MEWVQTICNSYLYYLLCILFNILFMCKNGYNCDIYFGRFFFSLVFHFTWRELHWKTIMHCSPNEVCATLPNSPLGLRLSFLYLQRCWWPTGHSWLTLPEWLVIHTTSYVTSQAACIQRLVSIGGQRPGPLASTRDNCAGYPAPGLPGGCAQASVVIALLSNFSCCPNLLPMISHRCWDPLEISCR